MAPTASRTLAAIIALIAGLAVLQAPPARAQTALGPNDEVVFTRGTAVLDIWARRGGGTPQRLTDALRQVPDASDYGIVGFAEPVLSPDRAHIAATLYEGSSQSVVAVSRATGAFRRLHGHDRRGYQPTWSPNGRFVAYVRDHHILARARFTPSAAGAAQAQQTESTDIPGTEGGQHPAWSPDGAQIAYTDAEGRIALVRPDGADQRSLPSGPYERLIEPAWSPDGSRLAAVALADDPQATHGAIVVLATTGVPQTVVPGDRWSSPSWSSDGASLVFAGDDGNLRVAGSDGTGLTTLPSDGEETSPNFYWSPVPRAADQACPPGQVADAGFADVTAANVHKRAIDCAVWWEVARGRSDTVYDPAAGVRRDQMASFTVRMLEQAGADLPAAPPDHFDDDDGNLHELAINQLAELGVVSGRAPRTYAPGETVRRDQMASFLVRALDTVTEAPASMRDWFGDDDQSVHEANINAAAQAGLATGVDLGRYAPGEPVRRDQMASFLTRALDLLVERGVATPPA